MNLSLKAFGPGLLYAAAAIGVSHLVQSTRAGASYGSILIIAVVLANLIKYPFLRIGPEYTMLSGESILKGYHRLGKWSLPIFYLMTLGTMFVVQAAVTIVTAGIAAQLFGLTIDISHIALALLLICSVILYIGHYQLLDNLIKVIIIILTITTIFAVITASLGTFPKPGEMVQFSFSNESHIFFLIALVGWMPAPLDLPIWHSMWTLAKQKNTTEKISHKQTVLDFNVGFITTTVLAACFLLLGSLVMYGSGVEFAASAFKFAGQLIEMYTSAIGQWAYPIIAICAFSTMFSTTLTCLDAFPRILREALSVTTERRIDPDNSQVYHACLSITVLGTLVILYGFLTNMKALVDFATTLSFVVAPIYAFLNYKVMQLPTIDKKYQYRGLLKATSIFGIGFLTLFCLYFIIVKFFI